MKRVYVSIGLFIVVVVFALSLLQLLQEDVEDVAVTPRGTAAIPINLIGNDAELFSASYVGGCVSSVSVGVYLRFESTTADKYYTVGNPTWSRGWRGGKDTLGYIERWENGDWVSYDDIYAIRGTTLMHTGYVYDVIAPTDEVVTEDYIASTLPLYEPGRYRAMYTIRDYLPGEHEVCYNGSTGEGEYEVGFEFTVPENRSTCGSLVAAELIVSGKDGAAELSFAVRTEGDPLYILPETMRLERADETDASSERSELVRYYDNLLQQFPSVNRYMTAIEHIELVVWIPGYEYIFLADFTENPDGTGERYALQLRLKFSEE